VRCLSIRPRYGNGKKDQTKNNALALLFVFVSALAHTLIVTDDTEIHDMEKPLPLHQLRRYTITVVLTCALASCEFSNFCFGKMCRNFETTPIPSLLGRRRGECEHIRI
jgi:hypothetical protein